jgi:hypothetical protein
MKIAIALLALACAGCSSGVSPSSITYGATQYRAIGPQQTYGVRPEVKRALKVPAAAVTCLTTGAAKGLVLVGETVDCLIEAFTPPEVVAVQQYAPEPMGACAPMAGPSCANGACSPPPVQTPALPRGACLPPGK